MGTEKSPRLCGGTQNLLGLRPIRDSGIFHSPPPSARYLWALDVFALPSDWEGLPIAVLEALACGVPQVATDVGGTPEAVTEDTGILFRRGDAYALADAVVSLLQDEQRRRRMAAASVARHGSHFTLSRMVAATAAVYEEAVNDVVGAAPSADAARELHRPRTDP